MKSSALLRSTLAMLALAAAVCPTARAAEHITLRNGSEFDCIRQETAGDRIRLYLLPTTAAVNANYVEVPAASILRVETIPDPPPATAAAAAPTAKNLLLSSRTGPVLSSRTGPVLSSRTGPVLSSRTGPVLSSRTGPVLSSGGGPLLSSRSAAEGSASPATTPNLTPAEMQQMLARAGALHNIDTDLLASVVQAESAGNALAVSRAGAQGLMQLMPTTAATLGVRNSFAPDQNISGGTAYLDQLLTRYRDNIALALAAYNAGPAAVDRYHGIPPYAETRAYVARVIRAFNRRKLAASLGLVANAH